MKKILWLALFLLLSVFAEAVKISGKNIEYAGKQLVFHQLIDPISKTSTPAFTIRIDKNGEFEINAEITTSKYVFCKFGIYKGLLILEPGKDLEIILPPVRKKTFADQKNPFFKPVSFWFNTKQNSLTTNIASFEIKYNQISDKYFNELYFRQSANHLDSVKLFLNTEFPRTNSALFESYRRLKLLTLETDVFRLKPENISEKLNKIDPGFWELPAFTGFFEKIFNNRLSLDSREVKGDELKKMVGNSNLKALQNYISKKYKLTQTTADLVMLKFLYDAFYSGEFPKDQILGMIQSNIFLNNNNHKIQAYSKSIFKKLNHLLPGTKAPEICLKTISGENFCSTGKKDKFKYLVFADIEMLVCQEQLKHLNKINEQFNKHLEIIVVYRDTGKEEIRSFIEENKTPGVHVLDTENKNVGKYGIKTFPMCFLLNENHEIVFQETRNPIEGFSRQFGNYLQQELFKRQRNQER